MNAIDRTLRAAVALFVLAGFTGMLFRLAGVYGWTLGFDPVNVRHAHSHLMYFGWVTPALFALVGLHAMRAGHTAPRGRLFAALIVLALAAWGAFLLWGYESAVFGAVRVPVSVIVSTLSMFVWYAWVAWYVRARRGLGASAQRTLWDAAVAYLAVSTLGAWGVAAAVPLGGSLPALKAAFAHLFLGYFSEGWLVLGILGLAWRDAGAGTRLPRWALNLLLGGVALSFLLGMPGHLLTPGVRFLARLAGLAWGVGAIGLVWAWWRGAPAGARSAWGAPLLLLAVKASAQSAAMFVPGVWWADLPAMRVLYLHLLLLGFVTPALAACLVRGRRLAVVQAAAILTIASLVPLTAYWPAPLALDRPLAVAAWLSAIMPAAALLMLRRSYREDDSLR